MHDEQSSSAWREPDAAITALVDAPPTPWLVLAPDAAHILEIGLAGLPSIHDVARPKEKLAGLRIDTVRFAQHQLAFGTSIHVRDLAGTWRREIALPAGRRIASVSWSHDARRFAFVLDAGGAGELWWGSVESAGLTLATRGIHAVLTDGFAWMPDGARVLATLVPDGQASPPERPVVATGPSVLETRGERTPQRTHQDLLRDAHDEALFEFLSTSQLALVDLDSVRIELIGDPAAIASMEPSPDGDWALVQVLERPWSRTQTVAGFGHATFAQRVDGTRRVLVARQPISANVPIEGVRTGPRAVQWSAHGGARVVFVEALDGGDPRQPAAHRDRWMELDAPFGESPREILRVEHRASGISWLQDQARVLVREWDRDRKWTRLWNAEPGIDRATWTLLDDRSANDHYADPGSILFEPRARGRRIVRQRGPWIFRIGSGEEDGGARPFLDRERIDEVGLRERLFHSGSGIHERPVALVEDALGDIAAFVTRHESPVDVPNLRLRRLGADASAFERLTDYPDPAPIFRRVKKELVRYARADGVQLSGTLHLPPDHDGRRLPLVVWAYPREFVDTGTASQVRGTSFDFTRVGGASPLFFVLRGYAVLEGAEMPVVGHPETMNDTFLDQIGASARAAIEHLAARGVIDPTRVGVGGHSYGAFMVAALLASTDLFRAGIARSGAYNRTLTPFGFQSERRTLWEARESYLKLSPLLDAHRIRAPLLLVHGAEDENPGTHPLQSERLFQAIQGTGGSARHVVLPHEGHGYRSREANLHVLAEMFEWFDQHLAVR